MIRCSKLLHLTLLEEEIVSVDPWFPNDEKKKVEEVCKQLPICHVRRVASWSRSC